MSAGDMATRSQKTCAACAVTKCRSSFPSQRSRPPGDPNTRCRVCVNLADGVTGRQSKVRPKGLPTAAEMSAWYRSGCSI